MITFAGAFVLTWLWHLSRHWDKPSALVNKCRHSVTKTDQSLLPIMDPPKFYLDLPPVIS